VIAESCPGDKYAEAMSSIEYYEIRTEKMLLVIYLTQIYTCCTSGRPPGIETK
jgi:hypothetical protein